MGSAEQQGRLWGQDALSWMLFQEDQQNDTWRFAFDEIKLRETDTILDAGCGSGGALLLASERTRKLFGIDASHKLVDLARSRDIPSAEFTQGELEDLPYSNDQFDVILASNSLQFVESKPNALQEMKRVASPEGIVIIIVWGDPEECEQRSMFEAIIETLPESKRPQGGGPFALSSYAIMDALLDDQGMSIAKEHDAPCEFKYPDIETALKGHMSAGPSQGAIAVSGKEAVEDAIMRSLRTFKKDDGSISIKNTFKVFICET